VTSSAIRLANVTKRYGDRLAVANVSIDVSSSESIAVLGPSGCGKTTLLRLIAGLAAPDSGEIWLADRLVSGGRECVPPHERQLGFVFQDLALWPHLTVGGNLDFVMRAARVPRAERALRAGRILALVHIDDLSDRYPHELSGGEQQRVALARALVGEPQILLLDEPFSSLDVELRTTLRAELRRLQHQLRLTSIYVTHDGNDAAAVADRVIEMRSGKIVAVHETHGEGNHS
jgi:ABC-type Fe3+/spermidine/putrescine transport system ATPase subunit